MKQCLVWVKNTMVLGRQDYQWKHEPCLYGWKPGAAHYFTTDRTKTTVHEDRVDYKAMKKEQLVKFLDELHAERFESTVIHCDKPARSEDHPTMKPVRLIAGLVKNSTKSFQIVADPFLGSGTTMVACHQLNRTCYGVEIDPRYCQVVVDRMRALDPELEIEKV